MWIPFEDIMRRRWLPDFTYSIQDIPESLTESDITPDPQSDTRHAMQLFDEPMQELRIVYTPQMYDALVVLNGGIPFYLINHQVIEVL